MHDLDFLFWKIFCVAVKVRGRRNDGLAPKFLPRVAGKPRGES